MITLMSFVSTARMQASLKEYINANKTLYFSNYEGTSNPGILFNGVKAQLNIIIARGIGEKMLFTTHYNRFYAIERPSLFQNIAVR